MDVYSFGIIILLLMGADKKKIVEMKRIPSHLYNENMCKLIDEIIQNKQIT